MKKAYDFITELDLGVMGTRSVDVSYSYDPSIHCLNLMSVHLLMGGKIDAEITDYLNGLGEDQLYEEMSRDCAQKRREEAEEAAEDEADRQRDAMRESNRGIAQ